MKRMLFAISAVLYLYSCYGSDIRQMVYDPVALISTNIRNNIKDFPNSSLAFLSPYSWVKKLDKQEFEAPVTLQTADDYAIHLMPKSKHDDVEVLVNLLKALKINKNNIRDSLRGIRFFDGAEFKKTNANIVLYPKPGKDNAQKVLDFVYTLFGRKEGAPESLENSIKITDLIRYAHGGSGILSDELRLKSPIIERKSHIK